MPRCKADSSLRRVAIGDFQCPLGVYPVEELKPRVGYTLDFEPADGDESEDMEEWPDRYVFDAVISAPRVEPLWRALASLLPGRVFPILDILGHDAFREIDPHVSYDLMGTDRLLEGVRKYRDFFFEDGLCGFGAMSEEPFFYVFVDEHKIVTVRAESALRERVEKILAAFDLEQMEDPAGVDASAHEHRGVLLGPETEPGLLGFDAIVESLREEWRLVLNIDPESNVDDSGQELGTTAWWCRLRLDPKPEEPTPEPQGDASSADDQAAESDRSRTQTVRPGPASDAPADAPPAGPGARYIEVLLAADCLREAEDAASGAAARLAAEADIEADDPALIFADRVTLEQLDELLSEGGRRRVPRPRLESGKVFQARWA